MSAEAPDRAVFWPGRRVLVTGHTGFKGSWLTLWLRRLGADVSGIALPPATEPNLFALARIGEAVVSHLVDVREAQALAEIVRAAAPEIVFHLAARPLVRESYHDPLGTLSSNVMGTAHLLEALRGVDSVRVAVIVTSDKVYRNNEWHFPYREDDPLGGHDPYSASKAAAELVARSYRDAFLAPHGVAVATARAGNVIGGGDWSRDRLVPDMVRAWLSGEVLDLRHPGAVRPWQHVLEPLHGYLALAETLWGRPQLAGPYNFGPLAHESATVGAVVALAREAFGAGEVRTGAEGDGPHEAGRLALEIAKSREVLGVVPRWGLAETVRRSVSWYRELHSGADARALCESDLTAFEEAG